MTKRNGFYYNAPVIMPPWIEEAKSSPVQVVSPMEQERTSSDGSRGEGQVVIVQEGEEDRTRISFDGTLII